MYEIIKNVELPKKQPKSKYPLHLLKVGEGFKFDHNKVKAGSVHAAVYTMKLSGHIPKDYQIKVRDGVAKRVA